MSTSASKITYLAIGYCAATMIANVMSLRMIAPLGIVMDAGALLYPVTFLLRDILHRNAGLSMANRCVDITVLCNLAMFGLFALVAVLPPDPATGDQLAFGQVLMPGILIVLGSVVAQFVSERVDGRIFHSLYKEGEGSYVKAVLCSNGVSIPIDSVIMCTIAFAPTVPFSAVALTIVANIVIKYVVVFVSFVIYGAFLKGGKRDSKPDHL